MLSRGRKKDTLRENCSFARTAEVDLLGAGHLNQVLKDEEDPTFQREEGAGNLLGEEQQMRRSCRVLSPSLLPSHLIYPLASLDRASPVLLPPRRLPAQPACMVQSPLWPPPALHLFPMTSHLTICWVVLSSDGSCGSTCLLNKFCKPTGDRGYASLCTPHHVRCSTGAELTWAALKWTGDVWPGGVGEQPWLSCFSICICSH